jgi:hypothetical protein
MLSNKESAISEKVCVIADEKLLMPRVIKLTGHQK